MEREQKENYPAPKAGKFKEYWDRYLPKVIGRDNFHVAHLDQLEVLCDMFVEYHDLTNFIKKNGYTYKSDGRYGEAQREYPEVKIRQKYISEMRQYQKQLGLILEKDKDNNEDGKYDEEFR